MRPARLLPESVEEKLTYGTEPGGGIRAVTAGLRLVTSPGGAIVVAEDRLPQMPQSTVALPERLGGGFLFVLGTTVWRADRWLDAAKPIFTSPTPIQSLVAGLDRVYLRGLSGYLALDGRSGAVLDLGPWPSSPFVAGYAAADGWRAAAITDLRGTVATFDAGATWKPLDLPIDAKQVVTNGDNLAIGGFDAARTEAWFEVRADGSVARMGGPPRDATRMTAPPPVARVTPYPSVYPTFARPVVPPPAPATSSTETRGADDKAEGPAKVFGKRPLAAAIEDGWPLSDGTAIVARDGNLARIRLADGVLTEVVTGAFPMKPARCHPVSLTRKTAVGAFGFVCGEPRGATVLYAYDAAHGRLSEIKRFDKPRVVTSSGNGALAVRGGCAEDADVLPPPAPTPYKLDRDKDKDKDKPGSKAKDVVDESGARRPSSPRKPDDARDKDAGEKTAEKRDVNDDPKREPISEVHPYCVLAHDGAWREIHVRGDVGGERVVVLEDGKIAVLSPPYGASSPARLTILDQGRATTVALTFPRVPADVARILRLGLWMDGFEERRPGVLGGWIEAGGAMLGIEIALDGRATPGQYIRDAGLPFVSGRYGLGWRSSQGGFETTDGGMTWSSIELPAPLVLAAKVDRRACGPVGCVANGWLRVGWGDPKHGPVPPAPAVHRPPTAITPPQVVLTCEPSAPPPPPPPVQAPKPTATPSVVGGAARRPAMSGPPVLGTFGGTSELPPFFNLAAPSLRDGERGIHIEARDLPYRDYADRWASLGPLAKIYAWGPKTGEWDTLGRWQVKWLSPFAGWAEARTSAAVLPPAPIVELTRGALGVPTMYGGYGGYMGAGLANAVGAQIATGDDPSHALFIARRIPRTDLVLYELEADRAPLEVRRTDGEPFTDVDGTVRAGGRWFVSTSTPGASTTTIWSVSGGVARELARVPRVASSSESSKQALAKLARHGSGRAIGLVVDGQPSPDRPSVAVRWVLPIDLETGHVGEPESVGYVDLARGALPAAPGGATTPGGATVEACSDDVVGWVYDTNASFPVRFKVAGSADIANVNQAYVRLRLTPTRACIEHLAGTSSTTTPLARAGASSRALRAGEFSATILNGQTRYPLRCTTK